jgi:hypothetical protein
MGAGAIGLLLHLAPKLVVVALKHAQEHAQILNL